jgi:hypothetical protein
MCAVALSLGWATVASAQLPQRDAADFNYQYTGADLYNQSDWTLNNDSGATSVVDTTVLQMPYTASGDPPAMDNSDSYKWDLISNLLSENGFTLELDFKILDPTAGTDWVFGILAGVGEGGYQPFVLTPTSAVRYDGGNGYVPVDGYSADHTDGFHTLRIAQEGFTDYTASEDAYIYIDDVLVGRQPGHPRDTLPQNMTFGWITGNQVPGTTQIDNISIDTTGAYAPVVIPEPGSILLLTLSSLLFLGARWRR